MTTPKPPLMSLDDMNNVKGKEGQIFDGEKETATIHRDNPIQRTCQCKFEIIDSQTIKCKYCSRGYVGPQIHKLYSLLNST